MPSPHDDVALVDAAGSGEGVDLGVEVLRGRRDAGVAVGVSHALRVAKTPGPRSARPGVFGH
jgi:hypothetical protein